MPSRTLEVRTGSMTDMVDITDSVAKEVSRAGISEGICIVFVPHTTAAVTVNEGHDPAVSEDILHKLDELAPRNAGYGHGEGNADAHIKASLMGSSVTLLVEKGTLVLGTWQKIFFCEFDGPRQRKFFVSVR
jgi:secondary thiamine-phosphate synthase enzyme